jgi:hypothetical protein
LAVSIEAPNLKKNAEWFLSRRHASNNPNIQTINEEHHSAIFTIKKASYYINDIYSKL